MYAETACKINEIDTQTKVKLKEIFWKFMEDI
jgi:hypothetical protein